MKQIELKDIETMAANKDRTPLALHWEAQDGHKVTTAEGILADIKAGAYTPEQFKKIGYCVTMADFEQETQP